LLEQQHTTKQILLSELIVGKLRPLNFPAFVLSMFMHDLIFIDSKSYVVQGGHHVNHTIKREAIMSIILIK